MIVPVVPVTSPSARSSSPSSPTRVSWHDKSLQNPSRLSRIKRLRNTRFKRNKTSKTTKTRLGRIKHLTARTHWANFVYFAKNSVTSCLRQVRPVIFRSTKFCQSLTKLQRRRRPALEQDKVLSGMKSDRFVNLHAMIRRKISIKKI